MRSDKPANAVKTKITGESGFTMMELLVSLAIVVLISGVVASTVPVAFRTYMQAVDASNAQAVLSIATSKLRSELSYAQDVDMGVDGDGKPKTEGKVEKYLTGEGYWASIEDVGWDDENDQHGFVKHIYAGEKNDATEISGSPYQLIQDAAVTDNLQVGFSSDEGSGIYYKDGVFSVRGLEVRYKDGNAVASLPDDGEGNGKEMLIRSISLY